MTRANLNFTYRVNGTLKTLYHYHNGDQYPRGIRDFYHVLDLLNDFTPNGFKHWISKNYTQTKSVAYSNPRTGLTLISNYEPTEIPSITKSRAHPIIGDLTDYSYVFNQNPWGENSIQVYEWDDQIFNGTTEQFKNWIIKQK